MTCSGIDGDEDFTPFILLPIPLQDPKEIWKNNQKATWNGRMVQTLNPVKMALQRSFATLSSPTQEKSNAHPFARQFEVLETADEVEEAYSDWDFAPAQELLSMQITEDMTLEQFLEQTGMKFDRELDHIINCKSWLKRMGHSAEKHFRRTAHSVEKNLRKAARKAEKTVRRTVHSAEKNIRKTAHSVEKTIRHAAKDVEKFVGHHPKEAAIIAAAIVVVIIVSQIPGVGQAINTAIAAALTKLLGDALNSPSRKKEDWASAASTPNPSTYTYHPPIHADSYMQKVFDGLLPPTPPPNHGIYTLDAEQRHAKESTQKPLAPPSFKSPSYKSSSPSGNFVQQFYNNLFQADSHLNPYKHIGKMQPNRLPEKPTTNASSAEEPLSVTKPTPAPSTPCPFKSDFGTYLENLHRTQITSSPTPAQEQNTSSPASTEPKKNGFIQFLEIVRQGLETIGRMSGPEVDALNIFNEEEFAKPHPSEISSASKQNAQTENPISSSESAIHFLDVLFNNFQAGGHGSETPKMDITTSLNPDHEIQDTSHFFQTIKQILGEHLVQSQSGIQGVEGKPIPSSHFAKNFTYELLEAYKNAINQPLTGSNEAVNPVAIPEPTISCHFQTEGRKIPGIGIGFIPGMNTSFDEALHHANHIRKFTGEMNISIDGVYNHSNGAVKDLLEIFFWNYAGTAPHTAKLLVENWTRFFNENPNGRYLQWGHSQGSIILAAALEMIPKEMQEKITVVTVGTAKVTPAHLACKSFNYASESDFIHQGEDLYMLFQFNSSENEADRSTILLDFEEAKKKLILLKRHPDAKGIDHDCESPTNNVVFEDHITGYLENNASLR